MMGSLVPIFVPLPRGVSLKGLVPEGNFYRRLETTLDLAFVRDLVRPLYARGGRPSVDPVVFFKLQLVLFFEDIRFWIATSRSGYSEQRGPPRAHPCRFCISTQPCYT